MIDYIEAWDGEYPIYSSDVYSYDNYIGYETQDGEIIYYQ